MVSKIRWNFIEFYAGDAEVIGNAAPELGFEGLRDGTLAHSYADLSVHISIEDLDILSEQIALITGLPNIAFLNSLGRVIGGTDGQSSAQVVVDAWAQYVAGIPRTRIVELAKNWLEAAPKKAG